MSQPTSIRPSLTLAHAFASVDGPFGGHRDTPPSRPIARIWRGETRARDSEAYSDYLERTGFAAYGKTEGNLGVLGLRRVRNGIAEFLLVTLWDSEVAIKRFAGSDPSKAVFYPEDERFLVSADASAEHFEVVYRSGPALRQR
jgi:heme-degrading monooxygenase HmoA